MTFIGNLVVPWSAAGSPDGAQLGRHDHRRRRHVPDVECYNRQRHHYTTGVPRNDVTQILAKVRSGDPQATKQFLSLVYDELRRLARAHMAHERAEHTSASRSTVAWPTR